MTTRLAPSASLVLVVALLAAGCTSSAPAASGEPSATTTAPTAASTMAEPSGSGSALGGASASAALPSTTVSPVSTASPMTIVVPEQASEPALKRLWQTTLKTPNAGADSAMAVAPDGRIWVVSANDGQLAVLDPGGKSVRMVGAPGSGPGQFTFTDPKNPQNVYGGVAFDQAGNAYVTDTYNYRVQVLDPTGKVTGGWGSFGTDDGQFAQPVGIAVDDRGHVFVADGSRNDIQEFTHDGTFVRAYSDGIDYTRSQAGLLDVGPAHDLYTTVGNTIVKIGPDGSPAAVFDLTSYGFPDGVVVDRAGDLWIPTDSTSNNAAVPGPLVVLDPSGKTVHVWDLNGDMVALDAKGGAVYVTAFKSADVAKYSVPTR